MSNEYRYLREFGNFRLDAERKVLWFDGEPVNLQLKEVELLCVLTENNGEVITKQELLDKVWAGSFVEESNLSRHIYQIRKIFKEYGESSDLIQTVPRRGYRFTGEVRENENDSVIVERHSVSRTLIEELENSVEPNAKTIPADYSPAKSRYFWISIGLCLTILTAAFGFYFYDNNGKTAQPIKSIAVLPLNSLDKGENTALSLGFADALITRLGQLDEIKVISINAVSRYSDENQEPVEIGKSLGVDAVLDGTLQRANGKLRVTLRLFRIGDGKQIWSNSFEESENKIFNLQDAMAMQTAQNLALNLKTQKTSKHPTENTEAYILYLQGEYFFRRRETSKGGTFFKKAIELDPKFAKAWAGLAAAYAMGDAMGEAEATVNKALELDPDLAEAHAVRGFIKMFLEWDWSEAEKSLNKAVALDPNSVEAHHWRGTYLSIRGRFDEAKAELNRALELDPTSANMISDLGKVYYFAREYEKAEVFFRKAALLEEHIADGWLFRLNQRLGREQEMFESLILTDCKNFDESKKIKCLADLKNAFEKGGVKEIAAGKLKNILERIADKKLLENQIASDWYASAICYQQLNEKEKAIESLNRVLETKTRYEILNFIFPFIGVDPIFDELRGDTRFQEILRKMNL